MFMLLKEHRLNPEVHKNIELFSKMWIEDILGQGMVVNACTVDFGEIIILE